MAAQFMINPDGSITAVSPLAPSDGAVSVTVTTPGGSAISPEQFDYLQPPPAVTGLSQTTGLVAGGTQVVITGSDLDGTSEVDFGLGNPASSFTVNSSTQITATSPAGSPGTIDVTVTTPGGSSAASAADQFAYVPPPAVTSLATAAGPTTGGNDVYILGVDLGGATAVNFGGTPGTILVDSDNYVIAASPAHSAGTVDVRVTTPNGTTPIAQPADRYTFVAAPTAVAQSYTVAQNATRKTALTVSAPGVLANDTDPQGLTLTAQLLTCPSDGYLALNSDGSFVYVPDAGFLGADSFTYEASNGVVASAPATVTITVGRATLTWNAGKTGNWTNAEWGTSAASPDATMNAAIGGTGSVVNVTSNQAAYALTVQSGAQASVAAGADLDVVTNASVTGGAAVGVDPNGSLVVGGTFTLDTGGSVTGGPVYAAAYQLNDGTASANLGGLGGVTKDTSGTVTLSGTNTYAGPTVVKAGTLVATSSSALPDGTSLTVGAGGGFAFDPSQAAGGPAVGSAAPAAVSETSTPMVAAGAVANEAVVAPANSTLLPAISAALSNPVKTSFVFTTPSTIMGSWRPRDVMATASSTTTAYAAVPQVSAVASPSGAHFRTDAPARAASAAIATNTSSLATPARVSSVARDAVFTSYRSAFDRTAAPADNAQSAHPWAWLAASESSWNSSDQNKTTDSATAVLDKVLARFGL
jgi:autotransporter-associated beta strand protein